jgi:ABC-type sugar transport system substrate-binding protein
MVTAPVAVGSGRTINGGLINGANVALASKHVVKYQAVQPPLAVVPLPKRPPIKTVDWVWCTIPVCSAQTVPLPAKTLGWHSTVIPYDITAGPQALVSAFNQALQNKPNYIGLVCDFPFSLLAAQLKEAAADHIPIGCVTGTGIGKGIVICAICENTLTEDGVLQADIAIEDAKGPVHMAYAYDPTDNGNVQDYTGAVREIKAIGGPNSSIQGIEEDPAGTQASNAQIVVSFLQANPDVTYLALGNSDYLLSLPAALQAVGLSNRVKIIDNAPNSTDLEYLREGEEFAIVSVEETIGPYRLTDAFARLSEGEKLKKSVAQPVGWHRIFFQSNAPAGTVVPQPPNFAQIFAKAWHV